MSMASGHVVDRIISLDAVHNFRDYGGYRSANGRTLRTGMLYRSAQHAEATPGDLDLISALHLSTIVDLRGSSERTKFPCARPTDFTATVLFSEEESGSTVAAPHIEVAKDVVSAADAMQRMLAGYSDMPFRPVLVESMKLYFSALATRDGASLVHCLAGKDRTGIAVALLHELLGVAADDIMEDYLLTNVAGNIEARIAAGASVVRDAFGSQISDAGIRTLMTVHPSWLMAAFKAIHDSHGSVHKYAEQVLGVTPLWLAQMESKLLI